MEMIINKSCLDYMKSQEFQNIVKTRKVVIVSDPPFNVGYHYGTYKDKMSEEEYYSKLEQKIYNLMCRSCPNAKKCHEECEYCDNFNEEYSKEERKPYEN